MSLQRRLILFFVVIVVIPLAVAGFVVQRLVASEIEQRSAFSLEPSLDAVTVLYNERAAALDERVAGVINPERLARRLVHGGRSGVDGYLSSALARTDGIDFLVVAGRGGGVRGAAFRPAVFLRGVEPPDERELVEAGATGRGFAKIELELQTDEGTEGKFIAGFWLDRALLAGVRSDDVALSFVSGNEVIASTAPLFEPVTVDVEFDATFRAGLDEEVTAAARPLLEDGETSVMASTPTSPASALSTRVVASLIGLLLLALAATTVLATILARLITQPLEELALGAEAISEGRFDHQIPVRSRDEVGRLAVAFNEMTNRLRETITQLHSSRDSLQRSVRRVGETLRSTHDMKQMLEAIVDTSTDAVEADAAVLWRLTPTREELYPALMRGVSPEDVGRLRVGEGIAGLVAERAVKVLTPSEAWAVRPSRREPSSPVSIAVPLYSEDRVMGVIVMYRYDLDRPFSNEDLDAVAFLAEQGGVAVENVHLHEEARRLSLTDGLTGIYNRRYFQMQFRQLLATAVRFERPFSVLMLDLDHFKIINDTHGHQRGDAMLVEFSQRVAEVLREVDTFARYGGEEFVALLSETPLAGARSTAEKVLEVIRREPFGGPGEVPLTLTVSVGIACYPEHGDSFRTLVETADQALYRAKQGGRDRACTGGEESTDLRLA